MDPMAEESKEKGNECMKKNNSIEAMLHYTQAIKIDPENPAYYSNRSLAFLKMDQFYFGLMDAEEVIRRMPRWTKGYFRKAEVQMATEHYEEAVTTYKKILEIHPDDAVLNTGLEKAITLNKKQKSKERRFPWFGGFFGFIVSVLLIVADETVAKEKALLNNDMAKMITLMFITAISAGFGICYKYFLQNQRCGLFDPPVDFFGDGGPLSQSIPEQPPPDNSATAKRVKKES